MKRRMVNWVCWFVFVVQQLINSKEAIHILKNGISSIAKNQIVEGDLAGPNQFPWTAAIYRNKFDYKEMKPIPNNHSFTCGGTIISQNIILTAAHCIFERDNLTRMAIYKYQFFDFRVVVGSSDIAGDSFEKLKVQSIFVYQDYNNESQQNDIALLKLNQPLKFNNTIQKMNLQRDPVLYGQMAMVAGWGLTCQSESTSSHLRFASVKIMPSENCAGTKITEPIIEETALCVGPDLHVYKGDSGGGMWMEKNKQNYVIGIVSFGSRCIPETSALFTNVPYFYDWIIEIIAS